MITLIFADRANIQFNRDYKRDIRPSWLIFQNGKVHKAKEFSANGLMKTVTSFETPLKLTDEDKFEIGDINIWIEIDGEVSWK